MSRFCRSFLGKIGQDGWFWRLREGGEASRRSGLAHELVVKERDKAFAARIG